MKEYIEREGLLNEVEILKGVSPYYHRMKTMIEKALAADVAPVVHGEWIYNRGQAYGEPLYFCSLCVEGGSEYGKDNYCPHCGAKMDGGNK